MGIENAALSKLLALSKIPLPSQKDSRCKSFIVFFATAILMIAPSSSAFVSPKIADISGDQSGKDVALPKVAASQLHYNDTLFLLNFEGDFCEAFTNGTHNEFSSPIYPHRYPPDLDCIKIISADPGYVIRLKFLDHFHLEYEENCMYDYLEIRDGQFGYSNLIDKICGRTPRSYFESSGPDLWLRFHSDKDIQYIGFKASYEFVLSKVHRPELEECSFELREPEQRIKTKELNQTMISNRMQYGIPLDCTWVLRAEPGKRIYLQFPEYKLEKPNDCSYNFVEIYGHKTELEGKEGLLGKFCGSHIESMESRSNVFHVRFYTQYSYEEKKLESKFEGYYNFFRELDDGATCDEKVEYDCRDGKCIDLSLRCNSIANCKLRSDEEKCPDKSLQTGFTPDIIIIAFMGCLLVFGMCTGLFLNVYRKLVQDKKELRILREELKISKLTLEELRRDSHKPSIDEGNQTGDGRVLRKNHSNESSFAEENRDSTNSAFSSKDPFGGVAKPSEKVVMTVAKETNTSSSSPNYNKPISSQKMKDISEIPPKRSYGRTVNASSNTNNEKMILYSPPLPYASSGKLKNSNNFPLSRSNVEEPDSSLSDDGVEGTKELCVQVKDCACQTIS